MRQQFWILNSSLLLIFGLTFVFGLLLQQAPSPFREKRKIFHEREMKTDVPVEGIENIYKYDLFGTFAKEEFTPSARKLVTAIPKPRLVSIKPPAELAKPEFLPPLKIDLKGIAFSHNEEKSISMIVDDTKKENIYHVGDTLKDAQLIRIGKNRITLLRGNGQHETIFLRKEDNPVLSKKERKWDNLVKKIEGNNFELDLREFKDYYPSLGTLVEDFSLLTVYKKGKSIGIKVASLEKNSVGTALGLQKSDLITNINGLKVSGKKDRIKAYDALTKSKMGDIVKIKISRSGKDIALSYKLSDINVIKRKEFIPDNKSDNEKDEKKKKDTKFKLSRMQEREKSRRNFKKSHGKRQEQSVDAIRQRLLDNMRLRARHRRVR